MLSFAALNQMNHGVKEIYLNGMTADQLSEMIRESLHDELKQLRPAQPKTDTKYLTRHETARRLRISLVTLTDWVNHVKICAHKIGGCVLFRDSDVEAALNQVHEILPDRRWARPENRNTALPSASTRSINYACKHWPVLPDDCARKFFAS